MSQTRYIFTTSAVDDVNKQHTNNHTHTHTNTHPPHTHTYLENSDVARESHPVADRPRAEDADDPEHEHHRDENVVRVGDVLLWPTEKRIE